MAPVRLHRPNPHYLELRRKPVLVISSAEHYGSVLNPDFNYVKHLDTLASYGFNHARVFMGTYVEVPGSFAIADNTLAPAPGRLLTPWKRSSSPGYRVGGNKFDLAEWDDAYFARLRDVISRAGKHNIILEIVLFSYLYTDDIWHANPMCADNNVNSVGAIERTRVYTLDNEGLLAVQESVVRRIVEQLSDCDNVYYEIINEPYSSSDGVAFEPWQARIAQVIRESEPKASRRHLVAQNVSNCKRLLGSLDRNVDIVNFHYATPEAVYANYHFGKLIADDETGFRGQSMDPYRKEAWRFMLSGGGLFSHLDYSYTVSCPDGTSAIAESTPGFGGHFLRKQFKVLKDFLEGFEFWKMLPANHLQPAHEYVGPGIVLAEEGRAYAVYLDEPPARDYFGLFLPAGSYRAEWVSPADGSTLTVELFHHDGGCRQLLPPPFAGDIALKVTVEA